MSPVRSRFFDILAQDLLYGLRGLRVNPLFAGALVLTLGLGIGAAAAMFSVVDALLLRPLPFGAPEELVRVMAVSPESGRARRYVDRDAARAWSERTDLFEVAMLHQRRSVLYAGGSEPAMLPAQMVSPEFEETLQVRPALGRGFVEADADPAAEPVVILSDGFWRTAFGADRRAVGRTIDLEGERYRVVGVMPEGFKFPIYSETDVWLPLRRAALIPERSTGSAEFLARLGALSTEAAQVRADALAAAFAEELPRDEGWTIQLDPLEDWRARNPDLRQAMWFLSGAVTLILLIGAVNAVNLLLVRGWSRTRELAVRIALGARRRRLIGQFVVESAMLAALAGAVAVLVALFALRVIQAIMPGSLSFFTPYDIAVEWRTIGFTFAVAAGVGLLIGVVPALRATRHSRAAAEAGLTAYAAHTPARSRLRRALVVGEVGLSVMLLVGAGLLLNSFVRLTGVDPGFRVEELAVMSFGLSRESYPSARARGRFIQRLEERIDALPGVEGTTSANGLPPSSGFHYGVLLEAEGRPPQRDAQPNLVPIVRVLPDFFAVLEVPLVAGRAFTEDDAATDNVIIDRDLARFLWGDQLPIGQRFRVDEGSSQWYTVVGLIGDLALLGPDDRAGDYEILYPRDPNRASSYISIAIRTSGDPRPLLRSIGEAVHELDPDQPIRELVPATVAYAESVDMPRFLLVLMAALSSLALLLAAVGIYGVLAFGVAQRRRELAVRLAIGARPEELSRSFAGEGLALAAAGAAIGVAGALAFAGLIRSLLFGVEPTDPLTLSGAVAVSLAASGIACYAPARRATRVDPVEVLKAE